MANIDRNRNAARERSVEGRKGWAKKEMSRKARRAAKTVCRRGGEPRHRDRETDDGQRVV